MQTDWGKHLIVRTKNLSDEPSLTVRGNKCDQNDGDALIASVRKDWMAHDKSIFGL